MLDVKNAHIYQLVIIFVNSDQRFEFQLINFVGLVEKNKCMQPECSVHDIEVPDPICPVTLWSDWSPCSKTCGRGVTIRTRLLLVDESKREACMKNKQLFQQQECTQREECTFSRHEAKGTSIHEFQKDFPLFMQRNNKINLLDLNRNLRNVSRGRSLSRNVQSLCLRFSPTPVCSIQLRWMSW